MSLDDAPSVDGRVVSLLGELSGGMTIRGVLLMFYHVRECFCCANDDGSLMF